MSAVEVCSNLKIYEVYVASKSDQFAKLEKKMKKKTIFVFMGLLLSNLITSSAIAEDKKNYGEIGYGWAAYEVAGWRFVPKILKFNLGTKVLDNVAIEGMGAFGVSDSSTGGLTLKADNAFGAYVKPFVNLGENAELFGKVGYTRFSGTLSGLASGAGSDSGISYGGGAAYKFDDSMALVVDYMIYYDKDGTKIYGFTTGLRFGF